MITAPGDWRPNDLTSFAQMAGYDGIAPDIQIMLGDDRFEPFGFAPGEDIGIWDLPGVSLGSSGGTIGPSPYLGDLIPGAFLPPLVAATVAVGSIIPEYSTETSPTYRDVPGGIYEAERPPEDWAAVAEAFHELNKDHPETDVPLEAQPVEDQSYIEESADMPDIWDIGRGVIDIFDDSPASPGGSFAPSIPNPGYTPSVPSKVTVDTRTGKVTHCKRRRRRRLLTPTDLSDLAALQAIVGKGDALKLAVAKAVRR